MSSICYHQMSVGDSERMSRPLGISPAVVRFVSNMVGETVVDVEQRLDADGFCFYFENGTSMIFAAVSIAHVEREINGQGLMSRSQFEEIVMRNRLSRVAEPQSQQVEDDPPVMHCKGSFRGIMREMTEKDFIGGVMEDYLGDALEFGPDRFNNSLRKVYWYRRSKNQSKK